MQRKLLGTDAGYTHRVLNLNACGKSSVASAKNPTQNSQPLFLKSNYQISV